MELPLYFKGLMIGLVMAIPVGPVAILCIRRTLASGRASGLFSGMGAATVDGLYTLLAVTGITFVTAFISQEQAWLRPLGGIIILILGYRVFSSVPRFETEGTLPPSRALTDYLSTLALTASNPATILSLAAVFSGLKIPDPATGFSIASLSAGTASGSLLWWIILTGLVDRARAYLKASHLTKINKILGFILFLLGLLVLSGLKFPKN